MLYNEGVGMKRLIWLFLFCLPIAVQAGDYTVQQTWSNGESITAPKLNIDINGITDVINDLDNDNIANTANIAQSKLNLSITNAEINASADIEESKFEFDEVTGHTHSGADDDGTKIIMDEPNTIGDVTPNDGSFTILKADTSLELATGATVTGIADEDNMVSNSATLIATQQSIKAYIDTKASREVFISSGTFTVPDGVTVVYITGCGAGAGGGGGNSGSDGGGGGGAAAQVIRFPITVTPAAGLTVTINAGGAGGGSNTTGSNGGSSVFDSLTLNGGSPGIGGTTGTGGTGGGGLDAGGTGIQGGTGANGNSSKIGGAGGSTTFGIGGAAVNRATGNPGTGYGSAGSGGGSDDGGYTGGAGQSGIIIVEWGES